MKIKTKHLLFAAAVPLALSACAVEPTGYYGSEYPDGGGASVNHTEPATTVINEPDGSVYYTPGATYYDGYWHGGHPGRQ